MQMMPITFLVDLIVARGCRAYRPGEEGAIYNGLQQILGDACSPVGHRQPLCYIFCLITCSLLLSAYILW